MTASKAVAVLGAVAAAAGLVMLALAPGGLSDAPPHTYANAPLHFTLKDLNGAEVRLESFKGKVILLNFWATWCGPCRAEVPDLVDIQHAYPDDVVVLGVVVMDRFGENVRRFASQLEINYPILDGSGRQDVEDAYGPMWGLPTTIVIGRDGAIAKRHSGIGSKAQFERDIQSLL